MHITHNWKVIAFRPLFDSGVYQIVHACASCPARRELVRPLPCDAYLFEPLDSAIARDRRHQTTRRAERYELDRVSSALARVELRVMA